MRAYVIGDIHGQFEKLKQAHALVAADRAACDDPAAPLIHVGDLVDRGPASAQVVDYLLEGMKAGRNWVVLKGNHDRMFSLFLQDPFDHDPCLRTDLCWNHPRLGGPTTLASYGVVNSTERDLNAVHAEALEKIPVAHRMWLAARPNYFRYADCLFVHAGIKPGIALGDQKEDDLVWIRGDFLTDQRDHGYLVVHGHTAIEAPTHYGNRLNMDSSAGYGGPVSAAVIEGRKAWLLTPEGRQLLQPLSTPEPTH